MTQIRIYRSGGPLVRRIFVCGDSDLCAAPGFHFVEVISP